MNDKKIEKSQDVLNLGVDHLLDLSLPELHRALKTLNDKPVDEWDNIDDNAHSTIIRVIKEKVRKEQEQETNKQSESTLDVVSVLKQIEMLPYVKMCDGEPGKTVSDFVYLVDLAQVRDILAPKE